METQIYSFTKEDLAKAFDRWNDEFLLHPKDFKDHIESGSGPRQAEYLIKLLTEVTVQPIKVQINVTVSDKDLTETLHRS